MTADPDSVPLREYIDSLFRGHDREHVLAQKAIDLAADMARENKAAANEWRQAMSDRERQFSTKEDSRHLGDRLDKLEDSEIRRAEREAQRLISEAEAREARSMAETEARDTERERRRRELAVWSVAAGIGAVLVNLVLRLMTP